jgi:phosphoglycerate dehydrogenase-like enzyme
MNRKIPSCIHIIMVATFLLRNLAAAAPRSIAAFSVASNQAGFAGRRYGSSSLLSQTARRAFSSATTTMSAAAQPHVVKKQAKIISLSDPNDGANAPLNDAQDLPEGAELLQIGTSIADFDIDKLRAQGANTIFVSHPASREPLAKLLQELETIEWVHTRSAGIDFVNTPTLEKWPGTLTNAKGQFSSTLAEYSLMACSFFAKDLPRLMRNKNDKNWEKYSVLELRGATLGIVGYGDIGRACAKLAQVYGMKIVALRRHPKPDPFCDQVYPNDTESLNQLFRESDYIVCSAPLTNETRGMIGAEQFDHAKKDAIFINVGRGPVVNEDALVAALQQGKLKGAALDVFATEPLPTSSALWEMNNVLLSPHNMDQTATFMHEATEWFVQENLPRFIRGEPLLNEVDPVAGY